MNVFAYFLTNGKHGRLSTIEVDSLTYKDILLWYLFKYKEIRKGNAPRIKEESVWFMKQNEPHDEENSIQQYTIKEKSRDREDLEVFISNEPFTDMQILSFHMTGEDLLNK